MEVAPPGHVNQQLVVHRTRRARPKTGTEEEDPPEHTACFEEWQGMERGKDPRGGGGGTGSKGERIGREGEKKNGAQEQGANHQGKGRGVKGTHGRPSNSSSPGVQLRP